MPKKIKYEEEEEEEEEEFEEEDEEDEVKPVLKKSDKGRVEKALGGKISEEPSFWGGREPQETRKKLSVEPVNTEKQSKTYPQRYLPYYQEASVGIVDSESKEVIANDVLSALANIITRLERIENAIGNMVD